MIRRGPRVERDFTTLRNAVLRDRRLSFRARGVLAFILSQPPDWQVTAEALADESDGEGRDAVRTALKEIETAGYMTRSRIQVDGGRWRTDVVVQEEPAAENPPPKTDSQASVSMDSPLNPMTGKPTVGFPVIKEEELEEELPLPSVEGATPTLLALGAEVDSFLAQPLLAEVVSLDDHATHVAAHNEKRKDMIFEAVAEACGIDWRAPMPKAARGRIGKAAADIAKTGAEPDEIHRRARIYVDRYGADRLTPPALASHWPALDRPHPQTANVSTAGRNLASWASRGK